MSVRAWVCLVCFVVLCIFRPYIALAIVGITILIMFILGSLLLLPSSFERRRILKERKYSDE